MVTEWIKVEDQSPPPHRVYRVYRQGVGEFHATPCYGLHHPWWVPRNGFTLKESFPIDMQDWDYWAIPRDEVNTPNPNEAEVQT